MNPETAATFVTLGGWFNVALVVFHLLFWRIFDWKNDLRYLTFLNRAVMQVLNLSLTLCFVIFALISFTYTPQLLQPGLGLSLLGLMALFWLARAVQQVVFFKLRHWGSWVFLGVFLLGMTLYAAPFIGLFPASTA